MGIAEKYGIGVWRWRIGGGKSQWVASHSDHTKSYKSAQEMGFPGHHEGDWAILRHRAGRATFIKHSDMTATGTLWYFSGTDWHHLYRRKQGIFKPDYLEEIKEAAKAGDVLVEPGASEEITIYDVDGVRYICEEEIAAVVDKSAEQAPLANQLPDDAADDRVANAAQANISDADKILTAFQNLKQMSAEWAGYREGAPVTQAMAKIALKAIEEANPSPTPGTTAINDYCALINDVAVADIQSDFTAKGIDSKGSTDSEAIANIAYCKIVGEALAGCGAVLDGCLQLRKMAKSKNLAPGTQTGNRQHAGELKTALADYELDVLKGVGNLFSATDKVLQLVAKGSQAAQGTSAVAGVAIAPAATLVGILTFACHTRKAHKARKRWSQYKKMLKDSETNLYHPTLQGCMNFLIGKSGRRLRTQASTAATAAVATSASAILTVTAIAGGANVWNPVGWTLLGVAAVGGAGIVGYKIYKRWKRNKRHAKRVAKYQGVTNSATAAFTLIDIYLGQLTQRNKDAAGLILESFGVYLADLVHIKGRDAAIAMVTRHLEQ